MHAIKLLQFVWASPCSLLGLLLAAIPLAMGGEATWSAGALEVSYRRCEAQCGRVARALPFRAIVFGHVILAVSSEELQRIAAHERVHVAQYERWGLLFFPAYGLAALWQLLRGRRPYWDNPFEIQARQRSAAQANAPIL